MQKPPIDKPNPGKSMEGSPRAGGFPKELLEAARVTNLLKQGKLFEIGDMGKAAIPALACVLKGDDINMRKSAVEALGRIGDASAVPLLVECLKNEDMRKNAAWALWIIAEKGGDCSSAVPELIGCLKDRDLDVQMRAVWALENIGVPAVPALVGALKDEGPIVRESAAKVLGEIAKKHPEGVASFIVGYVNGECGDSLLVTDARTEQMFGELHRLMLKCGEVMRDAA